MKKSCLIIESYDKKKESHYVSIFGGKEGKGSFLKKIEFFPFLDNADTIRVWIEKKYSDRHVYGTFGTV